MAIDKNLYEQDILNVSVKIFILNWNEKKENENKEIVDDVIASIAGYCTGGSLNLNGQSTVRRTGSLTIITNQDNIIFDDNEDTAFNDVQCFDKIETLFSTNKKIKICTGIEDENGIIQWQNQGIFIIKNPSLNRNMSGISISLTLSDKMCLLNGEMGGKLPAATVFSEMEVQHQDGTITKDYPLVKDIVETLITQYGGVNNFNIDIDTEITKVMKWGLDRDLYKYELNGSKFLSLTEPKAAEIPEVDLSLFNFELRSNTDSYEVSAATNSSSYPAIIHIPGIYNGKKVTLIKNQGFYGNKYIKSVYIDEGIEDIGNEAFANTDNLIYISLPNSLTGIGTKAFYFSGLKEIVIPENVTSSLDPQAIYSPNIEKVIILSRSCLQYTTDMIKPLKLVDGEWIAKTNEDGYYDIDVYVKYYNSNWYIENPFEYRGWPADCFKIGKNFWPFENKTPVFPIDPNINNTIPTNIIIYKYNDTVGYIKVPFTWPGQTLSANAGETITSVLDKIKALADYEYFFDTEGKFIWQKKNTYIYSTLRQGTETTITNDIFFNSDLSKIKEIILPKAIDAKDIAYKFDTTNLITSLTNTPQYNNMKNDFIIWGKRKTASGAELPIRYRLVFSRVYPKTDVKTTMINNCREYEVVNGIKGYKKYKIEEKTQISKLPFTNDDIYYKIEDKYYHWVDDKYQVTTETPGGEVEYNEKDKYQTQIYLDGVDKNSIYFDSPLYKDLEIEWPKLYNVTAGIDSRNWRTGSTPQGDEIDYYCHLINVPGQNIEDVGRYQTKVINDNTVNCIYAPDIPAEILNKVGDKYPVDPTDKTIDVINAYNIISVPEEIYNNLYAGGTQNSAFELARRVINYYTSYNNTISLSSIPIYDLKPNDIIQVEDDKSGIHGYYVVNTISLPLAYNGTMNISASRALTQEATSGNTK